MIGLLDMDGVIVDFVRGSLEVHNLKMTTEELYKDHYGQWDFVSILGMSDAAFWKPMNEEFWAKLEWTHDGETILKMVEARFGQKNVVIVTSPSQNYGCHSGKLRWMERHLPRHYSRPSGHMFGSLKHLLSNPNHMLIDDRDANLDSFANYNNGKICHVPRLWNKHHANCKKTVEIIGENLGL